MFFKKNLRYKILISIFLAIILRLLISKIGATYDFESYQIVSKLVLSGKNIYQETERYNYSPLWAVVLSIFRRASLFFDNTDLAFRFFIILILSLADVVIFFWLWKRYHSFLSLIFLFNPLSIYITGYHNQFDNLAIAFALWSTNFLSSKNKKTRYFGYFLLSISILFKHLFIFFPLWLFLEVKNKKEKLLSLLPYLIFLLSFLPFSFSQKALQGIFENVFIYKNASNIYSFFPMKGFLRPAFLFVLFIISYFFIKKKKLDQQVLFYLLFIIIFSPIAANQYLIIPTIAHLVFFPLLGILYILFSIFVLFCLNFSFWTITLFQLSLLTIITAFYPQIRKKLKFLFSGSLLLIFILFSFHTMNEVVNFYKEQRKEVLIVKIIHPMKKVFKKQLPVLKRPLFKNINFQGEFIAKENNLGFVTIPYQLENPSGLSFFKKDYTVGSKIIQLKDPYLIYEQTRSISNALTQEGIILGFPIINQSQGKKYLLHVFSTIPNGPDYITLDRHSYLQTWHFFTKEIVFKNPLNFIKFFWYKFRHFLLLKTTWLIFFKIYVLIWTVISILLMKKIISSQTDMTHKYNNI